MHGDHVMIFQNEVFLIALVGMGLVTLGFIYVIFQAGKPADTAEAAQAHKTSNLLRKWLFVALLVIFIGASYATLHRFPIPLQHEPLQASQVVNVIGHQWYWEMSATQVETGAPTEFRVTSADVNHDFAIYAPDGRIVVQTQAMPGFVNKILYTFDKPGTYKIRCLEYCGLGHDVMAADLTVVAATTGGHAS
jgi:cytochrome c oxidase subunit 2